MASAPPRAILVLGMHRSGTSAVAGALARRGVHLGDELVPAAPDNPYGYFEHAGVVSLHERLLDRLDRSWDDVRPLPEGWVDTHAAREAAVKIEALVSRLDGAGSWALKDPRMSRLLPLWTASPILQRRQVACLVMLRHPDEVAASLAARDGMPSLQAHVLWLRHVLDAVRASAGVPRTVLAYPDLLADPDGALDAATLRLGMELPVDAAGAGLGEFVRASARHHVYDATNASTTRWQALALEAYRVLSTSRSPWDQVPALEAAFAEACAAEATWIDALGATARASDARRRTLADHALRMEQRADGLQARIDRTDAVLAETSRVSIDRLEAAQALQRELDQTQEALAHVESLSLTRLKELEASHSQLRGTQEALARVEAVSLRRHRELQRMDRQLGDTQAALERAEALSIERMAQLESTNAQLSETQAALARVETLSLARLGELEAMQTRLDETQAAFSHIEALSLQRLDELQATRRQLDETDSAFAREAARSAERLAAWEAAVQRSDHLDAELHARIDELRTRANDLQACTDELRMRTDELRACTDQLRVCEGERDSAVARAADAERDLARIRASRTYRMRRRIIALLRRTDRLDGNS